ncbi:glycosyltransferase family 2 protein [Prochlorococcus marinus XMU1412]|uniref:glycosyltransferase family 2 protein n=1 Tax=Prochlorococcus marinus TaxID=1219 RepID=UPI001ADAAC7D|nr:glycosyltransferase family 2 protein [Prochlorococcus marinus]MBO8240481.1 glycosyltransferase family 2 protein [Prochlorococcus marinus XMU1412]MBW3071715.1 hypothetical protein [Prochlorococcus marinus str. MU1412]
MKFKKNLASIIMPSCHKLTSKNKICYENSIKQNYGNVEFLIFVNGIDKKKYYKLLDFLENKNIYNHKIKSLYSKSRVAIGKARRELLKISNGEYIIFLDSDDIPSKSIIKDKVLISKLNNSNIIFSNAKLHKNSPSKKRKINNRNYFRYLIRFKKIFNHQIFEGINLFPNSGTLIKKTREISKLLEFYPICNHEDFIFYKKLIAINKEFTISNKYLISYNVGNSSTSNKLKSRIWHFNCLIKELNRNFIQAIISIFIGSLIIIILRILYIFFNPNNIKKDIHKKIILKK